MILEKKHGFVAPSEFWSLTQEQIDDISNGCGPKKFGWIVPDRFRLIGVNFTPSCDIHDYCYQAGYPKQLSDNLFLENNLYCASKCYWGFSWLAEFYAFGYYLAVKNGGGAFYRGAQLAN